MPGKGNAGGGSPVRQQPVSREIQNAMQQSSANASLPDYLQRRITVNGISIN